MVENNINIAGAIRGIEETIEQGITALAVNITATAKDLCPVADYMGGNLKNSIQWKTNTGGTGTGLSEQPPKDGAVVGTPVEYGTYQEFGTRKMGAQPFLRPAVDIEAGGKNLQQAMKKALDNSVSRELK